jgi:hypothetical protein
MNDPGFLQDVINHGPPEAQSLLRRLGHYTHIGYRAQTGHVHTGRLYGHRDYAGKVHALTGCDNIYGGGRYLAVCGETVIAEFLGESFNVRPAPDEVGGGVTCRRCRKIVKGD